MSEDSPFTPPAQAEQPGGQLPPTEVVGTPPVSSQEAGSTQETYVFNPETFDSETEDELGRLTKELSGLEVFPPERIRSNVHLVRRNRAMLRQWSENFSGKVPQHWGEAGKDYPHTPAWFKITKDLENPETELSGEMVEAAVVYPMRDVPRTLGQTHRLTDEQIAKIEAFGELSDRDMQELKARQSNMQQEALTN